VFNSLIIKLEVLSIQNKTLDTGRDGERGNQNPRETNFNK
jgi:hypothetical protein